MTTIGTFVCSDPLLVGVLAGASLNRFTPEHPKKTLPLVAGLISTSMGTHLVNRLHSLPPIILAIIIGTIIGGLLNIEKWIERAGTTLRTPIEHIFPAQVSASASAEDFMNQFIAVLILFRINGIGTFGALIERTIGDPTTLLTKLVLDFFTAAVFVSTSGYIITVTSIPQLIVFIILFFAATSIMTLINPAVIADFAACGGITILATSFRLCGIRTFPTANMLSSLLLVVLFPAA